MNVLHKQKAKRELVTLETINMKHFEIIKNIAHLENNTYCYEICKVLQLSDVELLVLIK